MVESDTPTTSLEDISAGLLNGVMVILLGCALPGFLLWRAFGSFPEWIAKGSFLTAAEWRADAEVLFSSGPLLLASLYAIWAGAKFVHKNLALLRAREI